VALPGSNTTASCTANAVWLVTPAVVLRCCMQGMLQQDYTSRGVQELLLALCTICRQHGATMVTL
jgi:hypothetical protein